MIKSLHYYKKIEKNILRLIAGQFFLQLINASFFSTLLIYMYKMGYQDHESASFMKYRFLGVLLTAIPLGLIIRGKRLKPFLYIAGLTTPLLTICIIQLIAVQWHTLLYITLFISGIMFGIMQISVLPYILRNAGIDSQTEAISLSFGTFGLSGIIANLLITGLRYIDPQIFSERFILTTIGILGFISLWFINKLSKEENTITNKDSGISLGSDLDWKTIGKASVPTVIIAVGAGLTIPFMSLFFKKIHGIDSGPFALMSAVTSFIVLYAVLLVPFLKNKLGFRIAIPGTQTLAIIVLVILATTQLYSNWEFAVYIAVLCFVIRQPFMNLAGPMTSEVIMKYVGERNQEMMSAINAAIWSGSWWFSSTLFEYLRSIEMPYFKIFFITAALYLVGVIWYYFIILEYEKMILQETNTTQDNP